MENVNASSPTDAVSSSGTSGGGTLRNGESFASVLAQEVGHASSADAIVR